jgi:hypothetical protein
VTTPALFPDEREPDMYRAATISADRLYRYSLTRRWADAGPIATFLMLNPSTADSEVDDNTIRRDIGFARSWGCAGMRALNLYAYRSTSPRVLWTVPDPVGPENDAHLTRAAQRAQDRGWPLVAAWGANARPDRVAAVLALPGMTALQALGVTKDGAPRHPLYLPGNATLSPWPPPNTGHCDWCGTAQGLTRAGLIGPHDYEDGRCNGAGGRPVRSSTYAPLGTTVHHLPAGEPQP